LRKKDSGDEQDSSGENSDGSNNSNDTDGDDNSSDRNSINASFSGTISIPTEENSVVMALPVGSQGSRGSDMLSVSEENVTSGEPFTLQVNPDLNLKLARNLTQDSDIGASFVLMYSDAGGENRLENVDSLKFINVKTGSSKLTGVPIANGKNLEIGSISQGEDGLDSGEVAATEFDIEESLLSEYSAVDDGLRSAKNAYVNADPESKVYFDTATSFRWITRLTQDIAAADFVPPQHKFTDQTEANTWPGFKGYNFRFMSNHPDLTFEKGCKSNDFDISLEPPTGTNLVVVPEHDDLASAGIAVTTPLQTKSSDGTFHGPNDVDDSAKSCLYPMPLATDIYAIAVENSRELSTLDFGGPLAIKDAIPEGQWQLKSKGALIASFDLVSTYPYKTGKVGDTTYSYPVVYVPSVRFKLDSNKVLVDVDLQIFIYEFNRDDPAASSYKPVKNLELFTKVASDFGFWIEGEGQSGGPDTDLSTIDKNTSVISVSDPSFTSFVFAKKGESYDTSKKKVNRMALNYKMFGVEYSFMLNCDLQAYECGQQ